jgi:type VI secretion system protein VasD
MIPPQTLPPLLLALLVLALGACAPAAVKPPTTVEIAARAAADANPDATGRASPVAVSLYELRAAGRFNAADFVSLHERPEKTLAADLVRREELLLAPSESRSITLGFQPGSRHLGVVAGFRRFGEAQWRAQVAVPEGAASRLQLRADRLSVSLAPAGP